MKNKQTTLNTVENIINNKAHFRITSEDKSTKTAIGYVGNRSLRITIIYYLNSVCFTDLCSHETLIYSLI